MPDLTIATPRGDLPAYVATPATAPPWPGVVVVHDILGMSNDLRHQADWLASEGFLAAAPDLFAWGSKLTCVRAVMRDIRARQGRSFDDIDTVRAWLTEQEGCSGKVGVIGFCMGGGFALMLAPVGGYSASSVNYGNGSDEVYSEDFLRGACPIVASYGENDRLLKGAAAKLEKILSTVGVVHDVKEYPGAGHGFMNDHEGAGDRRPALMRVVAAISKAGYDEPATVDARRRITAFFRTHLA